MCVHGQVYPEHFPGSTNPAIPRLFILWTMSHQSYKLTNLFQTPIRFFAKLYIYITPLFMHDVQQQFVLITCFWNNELQYNGYGAHSTVPPPNRNCYNLDCAGFVQSPNAPYAFGAPIDPTLFGKGFQIAIRKVCISPS